MKSGLRSGVLPRLALLVFPAWAGLMAGAVLEAAEPPASATAPARSMAVTIDDLPVGPPWRHSLEQEQAMTERLPTTLPDRRVPAIGFVNENKLEIDANALNADWLDELLDGLAERGYRWVDLDTATRHPAYEHPIDGYTGPAGMTWLHRWAITADMDRSIFRGEPTVPEWVDRLRDRSGNPGLTRN